MKKKVGVITGTRAEYGLLKPILRKIQKDPDLELILIVTGMHLSPEFGLTFREIENDGFTICSKNEMLLSSDTPNGITKSIGLGMIGFAEIFTEKQPDMIVVLGDRYEILAAATAALVHRIPIAHIHGGELTEGAMDDAIRHSVTKMSNLHFTSAEEYRKRVIQLGEQPEYVFNVGSLGVENISTITYIEQKELEKEIGFHIDNHTIIVTYHPVTLENNTAEDQFGNLLSVLNALKLKVIFTKANSDTEGRIINRMIDEYVRENPKKAVAYFSMGQVKYLSALKCCAAVVGNSSSGILEAPTLGVPTVNIGERQKGRISAESVIHSGTTCEDIKKALTKALSEEWKTLSKHTKNPYEGKDTSENILKEIKQYLLGYRDTKKKFYDL